MLKILTGEQLQALRDLARIDQVRLSRHIAECRETVSKTRALVLATRADMETIRTESVLAAVKTYASDDVMLLPDDH